MSILKVGTTFSGIGAPEQALKNLKISHIVKWACDIDRYCKQTYFANHFCEKWHDDITKINLDELEYVDLYIFGFPCQDISFMGKQNLEKGRSILVNYSLDIIDKILPKYILFENVCALKHKKFELFFNEIQRRLSERYNFSYAQFNSIDFGVPQNRRRLFGLGIRKEIGFPNLNLQKRENPLLISILEQNVAEKYYLSNEKTNKIIEIAQEMIPNFIFQDRIGVVNGVNKFNKTSLFSNIKIQYKNYCSCLNLVDLFGIIYPNLKIRKLTPREYSRLQGFPDSFIIHSNDNIAYKQFGNSITVNILEEIFKNLL